MWKCEGKYRAKPECINPSGVYSGKIHHTVTFSNPVRQWSPEKSPQNVPTKSFHSGHWQFIRYLLGKVGVCAGLNLAEQSSSPTNCLILSILQSEQEKNLWKPKEKHQQHVFKTLAMFPSFPIIALSGYQFYSGLNLTSVQRITFKQAPFEWVNFSLHNFIIPPTIAIKDISTEGTLWRGYYWALIICLNPQIFFM